MAKGVKSAMKAIPVKATKQIIKPKAQKKNSKFQKTVTVYGDQKDCFEDIEHLRGMGFATRAIHAGNAPNKLHGGVCVPIDLSTTYAQPAPGVMSACFDYSRCGNPTVLALQ